MTNIFALPLLLLLLLLSSCGKEFGETLTKNPFRSPRNSPGDDPDVQTFFATQSASCPSGQCHPSVAKLVVYERGWVRYCTAVLVEKDLLATSSNCLSRNLKLPNISCVNNVYAVFPEVAGRREARAKCDTIVSSTVVDEEKDPALWRNDFAFIRLKGPVSRPPARISRRGMTEGETLDLWKMDYQNDREALLRETSCVPFFDSYANPFVQKRFSPMMTVADCKFAEGNLGAPLFNDRGEVAGLISSDMDKDISTFARNSDLLLEELASIQHAGNFACADIPLESERGFEPDRECFKEIGQTRLDRARSRILNSRKIHRANMAAVEQELEKPQKYFKWDVKFYSDKKGEALEAHFGMPKCFFDVNSWIDEFSSGWWRRSVYTYGSIEMGHPRYLLKTKLNRLMKPVSHLEEGETKTYMVEFNPADAYFSQSTYVTVTADLLGESSSQTYVNITDECSAY